jgi:hypothetical protein
VLQHYRRLTQGALLASLGFYLLVLLIDASRAADDRAIYWASVFSVAAIAVSAPLFAGLWLADRLRRKRARP